MADIKYTREDWEREQREENARYKTELDAMDPDRIGMRIRCPTCHAESWVKLSEERYGYREITLSCPTACGTWGPAAIFSPTPQAKDTAGHFDIDYTCRGDGAESMSNGALFRCPVCAIENPRRIMRDLTESVLAGVEKSNTTDALADLLSKIVATFDGVMRASNRIAVSNREIINAEIINAEPGERQSSAITRVNSFQNIAAARNKLLPEWDMAKKVSDWNRFVLLFQKRHLFAHTLGVADEDYLNKSGDTETPLGKKVKLSKDDVIFLAKETEEVVKSYFGNFLS
jgi:hypothetical protein